MPGFSTTPGQDPFTLIHSALWTYLTAYTPWATLVRPGARINAVPYGPLSAKPPAITPGTTPEVRIVQSGYSEAMRNSVAIMPSQNFTIQMSVSQLNVITFNQLKMFTITALERMPLNMGMSWVRGWMANPNARESPKEPLTGVLQWVAMESISVSWVLDNDTLNSL